MFYVYCRSFYPVYEPAEGGYYVSASRVDDCKAFSSLEAAYAELIDTIAEAVKDGHTVAAASWACGFKVAWDGETDLVFPWVEFDQTGHIGDGFELAITADKPKDEPYEGYC